MMVQSMKFYTKVRPSLTSSAPRKEEKYENFKGLFSSRIEIPGKAREKSMPGRNSFTKVGGAKRNRCCTISEMLGKSINGGLILQ